MLKPIVKSIILKTKEDKNDILKAFYRLSPSKGEEIYVEAGISLTQETNTFNKLGPKFLKKQRNKIKKLEEKEEDYELLETMVKRK